MPRRRETARIAPGIGGVGENVEKVGVGQHRRELQHRRGDHQIDVARQRVDDVGRNPAFAFQHLGDPLGAPPAAGRARASPVAPGSARYGRGNPAARVRGRASRPCARAPSGRPGPRRWRACRPPGSGSSGWRRCGSARRGRGRRPCNRGFRARPSRPPPPRTEPGVPDPAPCASRLHRWPEGAIPAAELEAVFNDNSPDQKRSHGVYQML